MAPTPPVMGTHPVTLEPAGCDQCGGTSLKPVGGGKFQCEYCGAFMLEREPPPLPPVTQHGDPNRPPPSPVNRVSAVEVLALDAHGKINAPAPEDIGPILDRNGPKGLLRPKPLSRFVKVTETTGHAPIRIQYQVFFEQRRFEEVMKPYRGEAPVTDQLPPLWAAPLDPPREVTTRRVPVRAQERIITCPRCSGHGWITCDHCNGNGRTDCPWCEGGYTVTGSFQNGRWVEERQPCMHCHGKGSERCSVCHGDGRVTCDVCQGQTRVRCTWERVEEFTAPTVMHAISHGRDWSSYSWMSHAQGELIFDRAVPGRMDLTEADSPIGQLADQVLLQHNGQLQDGVCHWSRLLVTRVPVVTVDYKLRSSPGQLYVYGRDQRVDMPKKPVGCMGCLFWALSGLGALLGIAAGVLFVILD